MIDTCSNKTRRFRFHPIIVVAMVGFLPPSLPDARAANAPAQSLLKLYRPRAKAMGSGALLTAKANWKKEKGDREFLRQDQYNQIEHGSVALVQRFHPKDHVYLGLGRSPTTIIAFLQNWGLTTEQAFNVPASGMRNSAPDVAAWTAHLDKFLPASVVQGNKDIVVIDRTSTGSSLLQAQKLVQNYLVSKGSSLTVKVLAYSSLERHEELNDHPILGPNRIDISKSRWRELYELNRYSSLAEFGHHTVGVDGNRGLRRRAEYTAYKKLLLERMVRSATLSDITDQLNQAWQEQ